MLPIPTVESVQAECNAFDEEPETKLSEEALWHLREHFPHNTDSAQVLLKVIALNRLYRARVNDIDMVPFARHIASLGIDKDIDEGSPAAVDLIFLCHDMRMYYSFATKFCSWHNPSAYPIYDRYVEECLWAYKNQDRFFDFHRQDLGYYDKFRGIVSAFREHYGLSQFSFKQIDKFLWLTGERILRDRADALPKP